MNIPKTKFLLGIGALAIVSCAVAYHMYSAKKCNELASQFRTDSYLCSSICISVLSDYQTNWQSCIFNKKVCVGNEWIYCDDADITMKYMVNTFKRNGRFRLIDDLQSDMEKSVKAINGYFGHKSLKDAVNAQYDVTNKLINLAENPKGSLIQFSNTSNGLIDEFTAAYKKTDLYVDIDTAAATAKLLANVLTLQSYDETQKGKEDELISKLMSTGDWVTLDNEKCHYCVTKAGTAPIGNTASILISKMHLDESIIETSESTFNLNDSHLITGFREAVKSAKHGGKARIINRDNEYGSFYKDGCTSEYPGEPILYEVTVL